MSKVVSLVTRRKIKALDKNIQELTEVTTILRSAMQGLGKYTHYSNVRNRVNDLFVFYQEVKGYKEKQLQILERLQNEQKELEG
jgi:hypothetical protein